MTLGDLLTVIPPTQDGYRILYAFLAGWKDGLHHPIDTAHVLTTAEAQQLFRAAADRLDL